MNSVDRTPSLSMRFIMSCITIIDGENEGRKFYMKDTCADSYKPLLCFCSLAFCALNLCSNIYTISPPKFRYKNGRVYNDIANKPPPGDLLCLLVTMVLVISSLR